MLIFLTWIKKKNQKQQLALKLYKALSDNGISGLADRLWKVGSETFLVLITLMQDYSIDSQYMLNFWM